MFILVEKGTTPTKHKILWQTIDLVAEERGEVVGDSNGDSEICDI